MLRLFMTWWSQSSHFTWLSGYLASRELIGATRVMMACISAAMTVSVLALLFSRQGPQGPVATAMMSAAVAGGVFSTGLWLIRWPSCAQSLAFAVVSSLSIASACLSEPRPLPALFGCVAFAVTGGYLAFFHTMRWVLYNLALTAVVGCIAAVQLIRLGDVALALVDLSLVLQINLALPLAIQILVHLMGSDLATADHDPLTGLLNRRAFNAGVAELVARRRGADDHLLLAVVDLDAFKTVNDTWGHSVGDAVLVSVARAISEDAGDAVVARSGGEEFAVATVLPADSLRRFAQGLCDAVADMHGPVTASVGTASSTLPLGAVGVADVVRDLSERADAAMYTAKRRGGNQCHHDGGGHTSIQLAG